MSFIEKNFVSKEKSGTSIKGKLVTKTKKHIRFILKLWYEHRTVIVEIMQKIQTSFKTLTSRKATSWRLKKSQSNDKLL